ncbi:MAG: NHLP leader peptide family RiPP precursor [Chloroflexi bacterium]|nr:NHLP leader peptide family RiPP precursor [Chloroflexota bacterium]
MVTMTLEEMKSHILAKAADDVGFRDRLVADPKAVISEELGVIVPEDFNVQVHEDSATTTHFVLPPPSRLTEADLAMVAGGDWRNMGGPGAE